MKSLYTSSLTCLLIAGFGSLAHAQTPAQPLTVGDVAVSGSVRARAYSWDWFDAGSNGEYTYPSALARIAFAQTRDTLEWQAEFAIPTVLRLPTTAVAAAPQGQLGLGASYFAANDGDRNAAALFLKQGFVRWKNVGGLAGQSVAIGRFEYNDGAEVSPSNATLAALERDRIAQRLIGAFGFSDVGRSIDGIRYSLTPAKSAFNVTAVAGRPTQGVFDVDGWPELNVNIFYGALTRQTGSTDAPGEWRLFALGYDDYRHGVVKSDNRAAAARAADRGSIAIGTYGGHYLQIVPSAAGPIDLLLWGAVQTGSWGALSHRAAAYAVEGGWQPAGAVRLRPWIRGGFNFGSGDRNATDGTHETFFQVMPTPRIYARLPFFNMMNVRDGFGEVILRPGKRLTIRSDVHALRLASASDLWYSGGGAFQAGTFGYTGRPSFGHTGLATLYDASADYAVSPHLAVSGYFGQAASGAVPTAIYGSDTPLRLGYAELLVRF